MSDQNFGFAYIDDGWAPDAIGQIRRATSICDKMRRLLQPMWGAVRGEYYRGNARAPRAVDALSVIVADRLRLLLTPLIRTGEIDQLDIQAAANPTNPKRRRAQISFVDRDGHVQQLSGFVRVP
jgi:hypothetical protein